MRFQKLFMQLSVAVMLLAGCASSKSTKFLAPQEFRTGISKIAVLPFNNLSGASQAEQVVGKIFAQELFKQYGVEVLEGDLLKRKLSEKRFDPDPFSSRLMASKVAEVLDLDAVVYGDIVEFRYRKWITSKNKIVEDPIACISARIVSSKTETVVWAGTITKGGSGFFASGNDPLAGIANDVIGMLVKSSKLNVK